jgi:superoxide reductase
MQLLEAGTVDASREKHIPEVEIDGELLHVTVGAVLHPMTEPHHIAWIYVQFEDGGQLVYLDHEGEPKATVALGGRKPVAVYEYCNLHGLWKKEL